MLKRGETIGATHTTAVVIVLMLEKLIFDFIDVCR